MIRLFISFVKSLFKRSPVKLAIVRKYTDANGSFVGELYIEQKQKAFTGYTMIGASLDTLPFDLQNETDVFALDTRNDFLAPMPPMTLRVGALDPQDNEAIRKAVRNMPRRRMKLIIQNRFIEYVLEKKI
jgi:hypothetical protein